MKENYYWNGISCCLHRRTRSYRYCHSIPGLIWLIRLQKNLGMEEKNWTGTEDREFFSLFAFKCCFFYSKGNQVNWKGPIASLHQIASKSVIQVYCIHLQQVSMKENYYWNGISRYRCRRTRSYRSARHCHSIPGLMWLIRLRKNPGTEEKNSTGTLKEGS